MMWMKPVGVVVWINCCYCFNWSGEEERVWLQPTFFHFKLHGFGKWKIKYKKLVIAKLEAATKSCLENETFLKLLFKIPVHLLPKVSSVIFFKEFEHSLLSLFGTIENSGSWNNSKEQLKLGECLAVYRNGEYHLQSTNFQNLNWS